MDDAYARDGGSILRLVTVKWWLLALAWGLGAVASFLSFSTNAQNRVVFYYSTMPDMFPRQGFSLEVHGDGTVRYVGSAFVKREGTIGYKVPSQTVLKLAEELMESGVLDKALRTGESVNMRWINTTVALYHPKRTASLVYNVAANAHLDTTIRAIMEKYVPTKELRCPFVLPESYVGAGRQICDDYPEIKR